MVYNLGLGNSLPKQLLRLKLEGAWLGKYPKKSLDNLLRPISATVQSDDFKFNTQRTFGSSLAETTFGTKSGRGLG